VTGVAPVERAQELDGPAVRTAEGPAVAVAAVPSQLNGRDQVPHDK
jgi:hypothetical protein